MRLPRIWNVNAVAAALAGVLLATGCGEDEPPASPLAVRGPTIGAADARDIRDHEQRPELEPEPEPAPTPPPPTPVTPPPPRYAHEWYVSPTGHDIAAGTQARPFRTIAKAIDVAARGDIIRVAAGAYYEKLTIGTGASEGTAARPIVLQGVGKPKIMLESTLVVQRPHWIIDGFDIDAMGRVQYAVVFQGNTQGSRISNCEVHHGNGGAGLSVHGGARDVTIENNNIHHFWRMNVDSHGVVVQPTARNVTIRGNSIHDNSGDSIQCLGPEGYTYDPPADGVLIEDNDLYGSVEQSIDIKTCYNIVVRGNKLHHARFDPIRGGNGAMVVHLSPRSILIEDNDFYDAGLALGIGNGHGGPPPTGITIRRNRIHNMVTQGGRMTGGGLVIEHARDVTVVHNTFTRLEGPALITGVGFGGPTINLMFKNNIVEAPLLIIGRHVPGLAINSNLYRPGMPFNSGGRLVDFGHWRSLGRDVRSRQMSAGLSADTLLPGANAVDQGEYVGLPFCGAAPDIGYAETGC
jgi:hypothetical protein